MSRGGLETVLFDGCCFWSHGVLCKVDNNLAGGDAGLAGDGLWMVRANE